MSSDGSVLAATASKWSGSIWVTSDRVNWVKNPVGYGDWHDVAISANGSKMVTGARPGNLWVSSDSGATWTEDTSVGFSQTWYSFAMSSDGTKMIAGTHPRDSQNGSVWLSSDSGATWKNTSIVSLHWKDVAMSSDGIKMAALASQRPPLGGVYMSSDSGATWHQALSLSFGCRIAMSADGVKVAVAREIYLSCLLMSSDGGDTWNIAGPSLRCHDVAMSADGSKMVAATDERAALWMSSDGGKSWQQDTSKTFDRYVRWTAMSADGTKILASVSRGHLWMKGFPAVSSSSLFKGCRICLLLIPLHGLFV